MRPRGGGPGDGGRGAGSLPGRRRHQPGLPPEAWQRLRPVCGRGKAALPIASRPVVVTGASAAAEVEQSLKGGYQMDRIIGVQPKAEIECRLEIERRLEKVMR